VTASRAVVQLGDGDSQIESKLGEPRFNTGNGTVTFLNYPEGQITLINNHATEIPAALSASLQAGQRWSVGLPGDVVLEMAWIAPGAFTMGSPASERGRTEDEGPQTQVTLTKGFWLGKYDVTQGQYEALMGTNPSYFKAAGKDAPVEQVSWYDAMAFCQKLTERERAAGRLPDGYTFTLPTEAQWEYACRAGTTGPYAGDLDGMAWYSTNSGGTTHPVSTKQPNAWGLYNMHGNVWEWCSDWYKPYPGGSVTDPAGPASGAVRVLRGGSWCYPAANCRSAQRSRADPDIRHVDLGFRVALSFVR